MDLKNRLKINTFKHLSPVSPLSPLLQQDYRMNQYAGKNSEMERYQSDTFSNTDNGKTKGLRKIHNTVRYIWETIKKL